MKEKIKNAVEMTDLLLGVMFKYELHAFALLLTGIGTLIHGFKEEGFAIISAALLVFKGKTTTS